MNARRVSRGSSVSPFFGMSRVLVGLAAAGLTALLAWGAISCGGGDPVGSEGSPCRPDGSCGDDLLCVEGICVEDPCGETTCDDGEICILGECVAGCLIGESLYGPGDRNPANECLACDPSQSSDDWKPLPAGTACGDGEECDGLGSCGSVGCTGNCTDLDGWYDVDEPYDCGEEGLLCACQDQEYLTHVCVETTCDPTVTGARTLVEDCRSDESPRTSELYVFDPNTYDAGYNPVGSTLLQRRSDSNDFGATTVVVEMNTPVGTKSLRLSTDVTSTYNSGADRWLLWNEVPTDIEEVEFLYLFRRSHAVDTELLGSMRMSGSGALDAYAAGLRNNQTELRGRRVLSNEITNAGNTNHNLTANTVNDWIWVRGRMDEGSYSIKAKTWLHGDQEPDGWMLEWPDVDASLLSGGAGLQVYLRKPGDTIDLAWWAVGTNGALVLEPDGVVHVEPEPDPDDPNNVYIDPSYEGQISDGKTRDTPLRTWQGINFEPGKRYLQKRGTVYVLETQGHIIQITKDGREGSPIYIGAYGEGESPVIDGKNNARYGIIASGRKYITIEGLTIQNIQAGDLAAVGIQLTDAPNNVVINRVRIHNCHTRGILIAGNGSNDWAHNVTVSNSEISNIGNWWDTRSSDIGVNNWAKDITIKNNVLYGNGFNRGVDGITFHHVYGSGFLVENNIIFDHQENQIDIKHHNIRPNDSGPTIIRNNVLSGSKLWGVIQMHNGTNDVHILNNIIRNGATGIQITYNPNVWDQSVPHNFIIAGNYIHGCQKAGIQVANETDGNVLITNNTIVGNGMLDTSLHHWSIDAWPERVRIYNNIIDSNGAGRGNEYAPQIRTNGKNYSADNNVFVRVSEHDRVYSYLGVFRSLAWMKNNTQHESSSREYVSGTNLYEGGGGFVLKNSYKLDAIANEDIVDNFPYSFDYEHIGARDYVGIEAGAGGVR